MQENAGVWRQEQQKLLFYEIMHSNPICSEKQSKILHDVIYEIMNEIDYILLTPFSNTKAKGIKIQNS